MISWLWLLPAFLAGGVAGIVAAPLLILLLFKWWAAEAVRRIEELQRSWLDRWRWRWARRG